MDIEHIRLYFGKNILLYLKNSFTYACKIISIKEGSILIQDKYNKIIAIDNGFIERIEEVSEENV